MFWYASINFLKYLYFLLCAKHLCLLAGIYYHPREGGQDYEVVHLTLTVWEGFSYKDKCI